MNTTRIGCAGWSITQPAARRFSGTGSHLQRYALVLNAVEINSSFYRPHQAKTYARWAQSVPDDFQFSVKLPRSISHEARLIDIDLQMTSFASAVGELGDKLGYLLLQLPPSLALDSTSAAHCFARLRDSFHCHIACEARHLSWFGDAATALLREYRVTRVIADPIAGRTGVHVATTEATYLRLHGSPKIYYSPYSDAFLAQVAAQIHSADAWCIFDNTAAGAALPNALALMQMQTSDGTGDAEAQRTSLPARLSGRRTP